MKYLIIILFSLPAFRALDLDAIKQMQTAATTQPPVINFQLVDPGALLSDCPAGCPTGWKYYNSTCYKKFNAALTYSQAKNKCQAIGAVLASITSADVNDALRKEYDSNIVAAVNKQSWIGLKSTNGAWGWLDGNQLVYKNWAPTEPATGLCGQMIVDTMKKTAYNYERGGWKAYACGQTSSSYICEKGASAQ